MVLSRLYATLAGLAVLCVSGPVSQAQTPGSPACIRLESQLAALNGGSAAGNAQRIREALGKQKAELDRTVALSRSLSCDRRIFIFGPAPNPQCTELGRRISKFKTDIDRLSSQAAQAQNGNEPMRRQLIGALAQNNCGPQYRTAAVTAQRRQPGLLGMLFGSEASQEQSPGVGETIVEEERPRSSTFRTVCVRSCDGFFFPISYTTGSGAFARDEAICRMTCPGTDARLFAYPNPGGAIEQAVSPTGEPYTRIPNAFRYRTEFVAGCSCRPAGMSWAEALAGIDDRTLRKGDIVVDEARSQAMSQPKAEAAPVQAAQPAAPPPPPARQAPVEEPPDTVVSPRLFMEPTPNEMNIAPDFDP